MVLKGFDLLLIVGVVVEKLYWCPFTKVEESFNVQATHDFFYHAPYNVSEFDHVNYPGVVPRTFLGSLFLTLITHGIEYAHACIQSYFGIDQHMSTSTMDEMDRKWRRYMTTRTIMACINLWGYLRVRRAIRRCFGPIAARIFTIAVGLQFHLIFYSSRLLPNSFGLALSSFALANFIEWQFHPTKHENNQQAIKCFAYLLIATMIFRCDIILLLIPLTIYFFFSSPLMSSDSAPSLFSLLFSQSLYYCFVIFLGSIFVDSYLWYNSQYSLQIQSLLQSLINTHSTVPIHLPRWFQPMWPEFYVFFFNTVQNQSSQWGVSPWHWYITSALPRTIGPFLVGLLGVFNGRDGKGSLFPGTLFWSIPIIALSFLGHKEIRFIFPSLLGLTAFASIGLSELIPSMAPQSSTVNNKGMHQRRHLVTNTSSSVVFRRMLWGIGFFIICSIATATSMARFFASVYNYPGGWALQHFNHQGVIRSCPSHKGFTWKSPLLSTRHPLILHPTVPIPNLNYGISTIDIPSLIPYFIEVAHETKENNADTKYRKLTAEGGKGQDSYSPHTCCKIHIDTFAAESGVSRYLEFRGIEIDDDQVWCTIDKTPEELINPDDFDFLISHTSAPPPRFSLLYSIPQFQSYSLSPNTWHGLPLPKMKVSPAVFVYAALRQC